MSTKSSMIPSTFFRISWHHEGELPKVRSGHGVEIHLGVFSLPTGLHQRSSGNFPEACAPRLASHGVISMLDATIKSRGRWLPTVMTQERAVSCTRTKAPNSSCLLMRAEARPVLLAGCYPKFNFPVAHRQCGNDRTKFSYFAMGKIAACVVDSGYSPECDALS